MRYPAIYRDKFPWYPKIDYRRCLKDLTCMNFCPHGVFEWDPKSHRPLVAHPYNCVPGCTSCADQCKMRCITLPSEEEFCAALRRLRRQLGPPIGGT